MSHVIHMEITSATKKDVFGKAEVVALVTFKFYRGDETGELEVYEIYDENLDDWVLVDLEKLNSFQLQQIQRKIDKHILENPEMFQAEPEEAS